MEHDFSSLLYEHNGSVITLTLNRPKVKNAFDATLIKELTTACNTAAQSDARVVVITGSGDAFCSGGDLNWMREMATYSFEENVIDSKHLATLLETLCHLPMPTIARVNGNSFGGAIGLIAACDMAIAVDSAKFCLSEVKLGLIPATIAPYLNKAIGDRNAKRLMLTTAIFDANEAQAISLISDICAINALDTKIEYYTKLICNNGPNATKMVKHYLRNEELSKQNNVTTYTAELLAKSRSSIEAKEGISAFLEKRKPSWCKEK